MKKIIFSFLSVILTMTFAFSQTDFSNSGIGNSQSEDFGVRSVDAMYFLTHSNSQIIMGNNTIGCRWNATGYTTNNSYMRVFDLTAEFGISEAINVTSVDFGIESAVGGSGSQPATVNIYTLTGPLLFANLTLIATQTVSVSDQALSIMNVPITALIPADSILVVEIFTPDGSADGNAFFMGSNNLGENAPSYFAAADCSLSELVTNASIGYPGTQWVMNVNADPAVFPIPISNWAILLGVLLIGTFIVVRYRGRLA